MKTRIVSRLILLAALCSLLSSCLGLRIDAKVSATGQVEAVIHYSISVAAMEFGFNDLSRLHVPLTIDEAVFSERVLSNSGDLLSWALQSGTDRYVVDTRVSFPTFRAFTEFLDAEKAIIKYDSSAGYNSLSITFPVLDSGTDPELKKFMETVFPSEIVELSLEMPKAPRSSKGMKIEKSKAMFSGTIKEIFSAKAPLILELTW